MESAFNAIKFTDRSGKVQVHAESVNDEVELRICDTGQGISHEFLPHCLPASARPTVRLDANYGGPGIGLPIVKSLVEMHGGCAGATSEGDGLVKC